MKVVSVLALLLLANVSQAQDTYFPPLAGSEWETLDPASLGWCPEQIDALYTYLEEQNSKAFILLRGGRIVLEAYFNGHSAGEAWYWASAGKGITAVLAGIARQEGLLSLDDTTAHYLGEGWTSCLPEEEEAITVWHQLTMTSGLDDGVADPHCTLPECLQCLSAPGTRWAYHNAPYTLLDGVIEGATGMTLNAYATEKLKNPTGMTGAFFPLGYNNVYLSTARSMARFGLLVAEGGSWNGTPVLSDADYFQQMLSPSQELNPAYGYLWWLNGQETFMVPGVQFSFPGLLMPDAPADTRMALGKDGQFINIVPSEDLVWIRMGEAPDDSDVPFLLNNSIWQYISELECGAGVSGVSAPAWQAWPNPFRDRMEWNIPGGAQVRITDALGRVVWEGSGSARPAVADWPAGHYRITATDGPRVQTLSMWKEE